MASQPENVAVVPFTAYQKMELARKRRRIDDELPRCEVDEITISLLDKDLYNMSVVDIRLNMSEHNVRSTVIDPRMGTFDSRIPCAECDKNIMECPGHLGYINLDTRVFTHITTGELPTILKLVCHECGASLLSRENEAAHGLSKYSGKSKIDKIANLLKSSRTCHRCGSNNPIIKNSMDNGYIKAEYPGSGVRDLSPDDVLFILDRVSDEDAAFLGFSQGSHPRSFVTSKIAAPPICTRPQAFVGDSIHPDHITTTLDKVVAEVREGGIRPDKRSRIVSLISQVIDNKDNVTRASNTIISSIKKRLDGKKGIVRGKMMGKRKDFTARTVLVTESSLRFGEVGVPKEIADEMPYPIRVTRYNLDNIIEMFGDSLSECKIIAITKGSGPSSGWRYEIKTEDRHALYKKVVDVGDIVDRKYQTGDPVMFGRQPTIRASSFVGGRAVVMPGKVFRIPMAYTTSLNADFDGDEAHMHFPQSIGAQVETTTIVNVINRILDGNTNGVNYGIVYNGITSGYVMTNPNSFLSEELWLEGYRVGGSRYGEPGSEEFEEFQSRLQKFGIEPLSGKALYSSILPKGFYYNNGSGDKQLLIEDGICRIGELRKSTNGPVRGGIIQSLFIQYGRDETVNYLTYCVWIADWYISIHGLTIGYGYCVINDEEYFRLRGMVNKEIEELNKKQREIIRNTEGASEFEKEEQELQLVSYIKGAQSRINSSVRPNFKKNNPLMQMVDSGAKGDTEQIMHITSIIGQQYIYSRRPVKELSNGKRCISYFHPDDNSVASRGFISHSYSEGMTPSELFFHGMATRIGLMDTGINTATGGAIQRKITKTMEDELIRHNNTISNTNGSIYAFQILENMDPRRMKTVKGTNTFVDINEVCGVLNS